MPNASPETSQGLVLELRREFNAPRERVFAAWSSADALKRWHAPADAVVDDAGVDFHVGGRWHVRMRGTNGTTYVVEGRYREIDPPRRIVLTWRWAHIDGSDSLVTVDFLEREGGTEIVLTQQGLVSEQDRDGHSHSWIACFDKLASAL